MDQDHQFGLACSCIFFERMFSVRTASTPGIRCIPFHRWRKETQQGFQSITFRGVESRKECLGLFVCVFVVLKEKKVLKTQHLGSSTGAFRSPYEPCAWFETLVFDLRRRSASPRLASSVLQERHFHGKFVSCNQPAGRTSNADREGRRTSGD